MPSSTTITWLAMDVMTEVFGCSEMSWGGRNKEFQETGRSA
jgi:hypothetical protein